LCFRRPADTDVDAAATIEMTPPEPALIDASREQSSVRQLHGYRCVNPSGWQWLDDDREHRRGQQVSLARQ
jgi:hypothetical protein